MVRSFSATGGWAAVQCSESTEATRVTLLAVDDNRVVLEMLTEALTLQSYEVLTAENARDALMLLAAASRDVVLLDIGMPRVDVSSVPPDAHGLSRVAGGHAHFEYWTPASPVTP